MTSDRHVPSASSTAALPAGVHWRLLAVNDGCAGDTVDLFDLDAAHGIRAVQWNFVTSRAGTLRGVHVHARHWDYLSVLDGEMLVGLHDMRPSSATFRRSALVSMCGATPSAIAIPPGVAHGFLSPGPTAHIYAVDQYWNPADEMGCQWDDPALGLAWPIDRPLLSPRDREAPGYAALADALARAMADVTPT